MPRKVSLRRVIMPDPGSQGGLGLVGAQPWPLLPIQYRSGRTALHVCWRGAKSDSSSGTVAHGPTRVSGCAALLALCYVPRTRVASRGSRCPLTSQANKPVSEVQQIAYCLMETAGGQSGGEGLSSGHQSWRFREARRQNRGKPQLACIAILVALMNPVKMR
jgi:hypothetical protein